MSVQIFISNLVHDAGLAVRRFSYDMQTNPRTIVLGYVFPIILAGAAATALTGGGAGVAAALKKKGDKATPQDLFGGFASGALGSLNLQQLIPSQKKKA